MARRKKKKLTKPTVVSFRCPDETLALLDAYLEELRAQSPGGNWTRSSAALNLVIQSLKEKS
jgi:hypothetical protein